MLEYIGIIKGLLKSFLNGLLQAKANNPPLDVDSSWETSLVGQYYTCGGERTKKIIRKIRQAAAVFAIDWCDVCRA